MLCRQGRKAECLWYSCMVSLNFGMGKHNPQNNGLTLTKRFIISPQKKVQNG